MGTDSASCSPLSGLSNAAVTCPAELGCLALGDGGERLQFSGDVRARRLVDDLGSAPLLQLSELFPPTGPVERHAEPAQQFPGDEGPVMFVDGDQVTFVHRQVAMLARHRVV